MNPVSSRLTDADRSKHTALHLYGNHLGALWELCPSRRACHFLVGKTSLLERRLPGRSALKY